MGRRKNSSLLMCKVDKEDKKLKKWWNPKSIEMLKELIDKGVISETVAFSFQTLLNEDDFLLLYHKLKRNRYKTIGNELINKSDLNDSVKKFTESIDKAILQSLCDLSEHAENNETADYEKDPGIQKSQHTEAHVKQGDHVEIESDETKKQTRNNENCKTVDHVKKGTNNESSKDSENGQNEQSDDDDDEERDDVNNDNTESVSLESHSNRPVSNSVLESDIQPELPQAGVAEYQPQFVAPTQCTSPPDDKPVKLTFIVTVPNHESNEADLVTEPTDCTSPPDGESIKPTFVVTVRSSSEKAISKKAQPQEFPVDLPGTKHNIPVEVTIMNEQEDTPELPKPEETFGTDILVAGQLGDPPFVSSAEINDGICETPELAGDDNGDCDGAVSETSQYSTFKCGPAEVVDSNDEDEYDDDN